MGSRYRSSGAVSRRRSTRKDVARKEERRTRRSIRVHEVGSQAGYYIENSGRYSAAHRPSARRAAQAAPAVSAVPFANIPWDKLLSVCAVVARVVAYAMVLVVLGNTFLSGGARAALVDITGALSKLVPPLISGLYVFQSPFGGAFRGDIAIVAIVLLVVDWLMLVIASAMQSRSGRYA